MTTSIFRVLGWPFATLFDIARSTAPILRRERISLLRTRLAFWVTVTTVAAAQPLPMGELAGQRHDAAVSGSAVGTLLLPGDV